MIRVYRIAISCVVMLWASLLCANVRIVITEGVDSARPIAVLPFKWKGVGDAPDNIQEIISSDLRNSGIYSPVAESKFPQLPERVSELNPQLWISTGSDVVVMGSIQPEADGKFRISYQLVDLVSSPGDILRENQFSVSSRWLRYAAHTASDEIFEKLTGIKGAFRTRIAYVARNSVNNKYSYELRVSDYDGWDQVAIHRTSEPLMSPSWSPDGSKLAFVSFEGRRARIKLKELSSGVVQTLTTLPGHNGAPAFSPDGTKLAFSSSKDGSLNLYVMDLDSRSVQQITRSRSNNTEPSWLPDNRTLIYTSDQAGRPQLYSIDIYGGSPKRITWEGRQNQNAAVASDGSYIAFVSTNDTKEQRINKFDRATGAMQMLTSTFLDETPSIAPNGTMIIYSSTEGYKNILNLVSADGRFKARLPASDGDIKFPAWSPYLKNN